MMSVSGVQFCEKSGDTRRLHNEEPMIQSVTLHGFDRKFTEPRSLELRITDRGEDAPVLELFFTRGEGQPRCLESWTGDGWVSDFELSHFASVAAHYEQWYDKMIVVPKLQPPPDDNPDPFKHKIRACAVFALGNCCTVEIEARIAVSKPGDVSMLVQVIEYITDEEAFIAELHCKGEELRRFGIGLHEITTHWPDWLLLD